MAAACRHSAACTSVASACHFYGIESANALNVRPVRNEETTLLQRFTSDPNRRGSAFPATLADTSPAHLYGPIAYIASARIRPRSNSLKVLQPQYFLHFGHGLRGHFTRLISTFLQHSQHLAAILLEVLTTRANRLQQIL